MSWITVETPNAIYKVVLEQHFRRPRLPEGLDAVVAELPWTFADQSLQFENVKYKKFLVDSSSKNAVLIGDVDVSTKEMKKYRLKSNLVSYLKITPPMVLTLGLILPLAIATVVGVPMGGEMGKVKKKIALPSMWILNKLGGDRLDDYRNAIISKKAEEVIAPEIRKRIGRKPVIAIVYGSAHYLISNLLRSPAKRNRILSRFPRKRLGEQPNLEKVLEVNYDPQRKVLKIKPLESTITIPSFKPLKKMMRARARLARMKTKRLWRRMRK